MGVGGYKDRKSSDLPPQQCQVRASRRALGGPICHIWQDPYCSGSSQPAGGGRGEQRAGITNSARKKYQETVTLIDSQWPQNTMKQTHPGICVSVSCLTSSQAHKSEIKKQIASSASLKVLYKFSIKARDLFFVLNIVS